MDTNNAILSADAYEALVIDALLCVGLDYPEANEVSRGRWPMTPDAVLGELYARGLALDHEDLAAYLRHEFNRTHFPDGEPVNSEISWNRKHVERALSYAVANGRGKRVPPISRGTKGVELTLAEMLDGLRSSDMATRVVSGGFLGRAIGAGLKIAGEHEEDVSSMLQPQLADLLSQAMAGEAAAVDELARSLTNVHPASNPAFDPVRN